VARTYDNRVSARHRKMAGNLENQTTKASWASERELDTDFVQGRNATPCPYPSPTSNSTSRRVPRGPTEGLDYVLFFCAPHATTHPTPHPRGQGREVSTTPASHKRRQSSLNTRRRKERGEQPSGASNKNCTRALGTQGGGEKEAFGVRAHHLSCQPREPTVLRPGGTGTVSGGTVRGVRAREYEGNAQLRAHACGDHAGKCDVVCEVVNQRRAGVRVR
jgi:hypothetical protein